jgi:hypothetical protein
MPVDIASAVTPEYTASINVPLDGEQATSASLQAMILPVANRVEFLRQVDESAPWIRSEIFEDFRVSRAALANGDSLWERHWVGLAPSADWTISQALFLDALGCVRFRNASGSATQWYSHEDVTSNYFSALRRIVARVRAGNISTGMNFDVGISGIAGGSITGTGDRVSCLFHPATSPNWQLRTANGASDSLVDTGVPVAADTWYQLDLVADGAGEYTLSIDGDTPVTAVSNKPSLTDFGGLHWMIEAPNAGATRDWILDFIYARFDQTDRVIL